MTMPLSALETALRDLATTQLLHVSALAMLLWDYVLTFERERDFIWFHGWSWVQACYLLGRYFPIVAQIFNVGSFLSRDVSTELCEGWLKVFMPIQLTVTWAAASCIVAHRVAALYAWHRGVTFVLSLLLACTIFWVALIFGITVHPDQLTAHAIPGMRVCSSASSLPLLYIVMVPPVIFDIIACALALYKVALEPRLLGTTRVTLHGALARDSLLYFVVMFGEFMAQLLLLRYGRATLREATQGLSIALCSICSNRIVFSTHSALAAADAEFASGSLPVDPPSVSDYEQSEYSQENTAYKGKQWAWAEHYP